MHILSLFDFLVTYQKAIIDLIGKPIYNLDFRMPTSRNSCTTCGVSYKINCAYIMFSFLCILNDFKPQ